MGLARWCLGWVSVMEMVMVTEMVWVSANFHQVGTANNKG